MAETTTIEPIPAVADTGAGRGWRLARRIGDPAIVAALLILLGPSGFGDTPEAPDTHDTLILWLLAAGIAWPAYGRLKARGGQR